MSLANKLSSAWPASTGEVNLAVNARDAMPKGGMLASRTSNAALEQSHTRLHEGLQPGDYVVISVSDTGCGMPPNVLAPVVEPFFSTKPIGQGTDFRFPWTKWPRKIRDMLSGGAPARAAPPP